MKVHRDSGILLLDNHDSFTWNLVELLRSLGKSNVYIETPESLKISRPELYRKIIFSPGPGVPDEHPVMFRILEYLERSDADQRGPAGILGVCLGMQAIARYFGGKLYQQEQVLHGQSRRLKIIRPDHGLFRGIDQGVKVGLYHSWAVEKESLPGCLEILAESEEGTVMAIAHKTLPVCGVQFHPESIITEAGAAMMQNWLEMDSAGPSAPGMML